MIVIPDVHGRDFWKQAVEEAAPKEEIIFLGDYLDPYGHEGITPEQAIPVLEEIIALKKKYPMRVTLLLGNHDLMGYHTDKMGWCRTDLENIERIRAIYDGSHDLFDMAAIREHNGQKLVFSHAGIQREWAEEVTVREILGEDNKDIESIVARLNDMWHSHDERLYEILNHISFIRGGWSHAGSPVWADMREWSLDQPDYPGYYQFFGHTQQWEEPVFTNHWANLDCRQSFAL